MSALEAAVEQANRELGPKTDARLIIKRAKEILRETPTERQVEVLRLIASSTAKNGYAPTFREITVALGVTSTHTVACYLEPLRKRGLVSWVPKSGRTLAVTVAGQRWLTPEAA